MKSACVRRVGSVRRPPNSRPAWLEFSHMEQEFAYLDNNATTKPAPEVVEAMLPYLTDLYGNPSSVHRFGQRARRGMDEARAQVAGLIGCADSEILFTGGGTEAVNTAVRGLLAARAP